MDTRIRRIVVADLEPADQAAAVALLRDANLPLEGFGEPHVIRFAAKDGAAVVGTAALEVYGRYGLLRSVAVAEEYRGRQVGARLTSHVLEAARTRGLTAVYLLTETAAGFFPRFGFAPVARAEVPDAVKQSVEFTSACPASAAVFGATLASN